MFPRNSSWRQRVARALIAQFDSQVTTFLTEGLRRTRRSQPRDCVHKL